MAYYTQVVPSSGDAQEKLAKIQRTHLDYLQLDENKEKLKNKSDLEELIAYHLSNVPHKEKFPCPKFLEVLRRSVEDNTDLKANKASRAFDALGKYAVNLFSQPWRQEYRCIRLYSGFFQHHVHAHLSNAIEILHLMGYEDSSKMEVVLNEPIDPDKIIDVSLNCLIATVECKIMMQVMEKTGGCYQLREVAYVRRHNVCDVETTVYLLLGIPKRNRSMDAGHHEKNADSRIRPPNRSNGYVKVEKLVDVPCDWIDGGMDMMRADSMYPVKYGSSWATQKQLRNGHNLDVTPSKPLTTDEHIATACNYLNKVPKMSRQAYDAETRADSWGYVDQSLERKGYNKDFGERGDLLKAHRGRGTTEARKMVGHLPNYVQSYPRNISQCAIPNQMKVKQEWEYYLQPGFQGLALDENELRKLEYQGTMAQKFPPMPVENLINLEPTYADPRYCQPKIVSGHVYRTNVPFVQNQYLHSLYGAVPTMMTAPQLTRSYLPALNNRGVRDEVGTTSQLENGKTTAKSGENRRSWYDNVADDKQDMPPANKVAAHLGESIVLPPPTPFQTESEPVPKPTHRRRASDGVASAESSVPVPNRLEKSNSSDRKPTERRRDEKPGKEASLSRDVPLMRDGPRRTSSVLKHERSPSAGSIKSGGFSSSSSSAPSSGNKWNCWACTFLNRPELDICEMCSRSRNRGAESSPLTSGGHECRQCTLVNEKGAVKCVACGLGLENSPTYV